MRVFRFLTRSQLYALPDPVWLIDTILMEQSLTMIFGHTSVGKTFVTLDQALSIATGRDWHGFRVRQGPVVYVLAEGLGGAKRRVRAWEERYGPIAEDQFYLQPEPVNFSDDAEVRHWLASLPCPRPKLVGVDTLSRNMTGEENTELKPVIANFTRVKEQTGATILFNHHPAQGTKRPRGSTNIPCDIDAYYYLSRATGATIKLECQKQRDASEAPPVLLDKQLTPSRFGPSLTLTLTQQAGHPEADAEAPKAEAEAVQGEGEVQEGEGDDTVAAKLLTRYTRTGSLDGWEADCSRASYFRVRKALLAAGKIPAIH